MQNLYIIRHPQTGYNEQEIFHGWSDAPLTREGKKTLKLFQQYFQNKKIDQVLSSPFRRCQLTARGIAQKLKIPVEVKEELQEICYGSWEGKAKVKLRNTPAWDLREKNRFTFKHPGNYRGKEGESYQDLYRRLCSFWEKLKKHPTPNILVVAHIGVLIAAKKYFAEVSVAEINQYRPPHNTLLKISFDQNKKSYPFQETLI